jgi:signal peptidase I
VKAPQRTTRRSIGRVVRGGLALTIAAAWFVLLRPQHLGGPAAYVIVAGDSMLPGLHSGDLVVAMSKQAYAVGDVIVYAIPADSPGAGSQVIHRIIGGDAEAGFITQGDNRDTADPWRPTSRDVVGRLALSVPAVGHAFAFVRSPLGLGALAGFSLFAFLVVGDAPRKQAAGNAAS